jgi:hypothetical protein
MGWNCTELGREEWVLKTVTLMQPHIMDLDGDSPEDYGKLRPIDDREIPDATFSALILEIQDGLMKHLVMVYQEVLHDKELDQESLKAVLEEPEPPSLLMSKEGEWPSAIDLACETPYLAPQQIDLGRIQYLI